MPLTKTLVKVRNGLLAGKISKCYMSLFFKHIVRETCSNARRRGDRRARAQWFKTSTGRRRSRRESIFKRRHMSRQGLSVTRGGISFEVMEPFADRTIIKPFPDRTKEPFFDFAKTGDEKASVALKIYY